jgi:hypothetical protein
MNSTDGNQKQPSSAAPNNENTAAMPKDFAGDPQDQSKNGARRRKDENRLHAPKHRILSRNLLQALADRGENIREWQRTIRAYHVELQIQDQIGEMIFDRMCCSLMRCTLVTHAERTIFIAEDQGPGFDTRLKQASLIALATNSVNVGGPQAVNLLNYLSILQRYEAFYRREFNRDLGALLALRDGGPTALADFLNGIGRQKRDKSGESND